jgi:DNA-binding NarL/FixJ family response regulator
MSIDSSASEENTLEPGTHRPQRILIVDDHPFIIRGLTLVLRDAFPDAVITGAADSTQARQHLHSDTWDIVILDLSLPGQSGLAFLKDLKRPWPDLPVLILSVHSNSSYVQASVRAGAQGYLTKEAAAAEVVAAIRTVLAGGSYFSRDIRPSLFAGP